MDVITETNDPGAPQARRSWWLPALFVIVVVLTAVWFTRAAMWPCGALDGSSGCLSHVALDLDAAGLDPATARPGWLAFDLGPGAEIALVTASGPTTNGGRGVLALFDTRTGGLIRLLHAEDFPNGDPGFEPASEAALSPDGTRAAAAIRSRSDQGAPLQLRIYDTRTGDTVRTLAAQEFGPDCTAMLDFSPDGAKLQCGFTVYDIETGQASSALNDDDMLLPMFADFPPGGRAPDGTVVRPTDLPMRTNIFDADATTHFAPDSIGLVEVWRAYRENRGQRWWTPSVFRYLSSVGVWDGQTKTLLRRIYANERYEATTWSRDGSHFGFVSDDFHLTVFRR
jgi:WD40 repeat protein